MSLWTEHRNPEGRTYWFNTQTRESVWEKPDELKTPFEKALNQTKWKEYFSGGRKYYYNTETKESKWDMPDELLLLLEKVEKEGKTATQPTSAVVPAGAPAFATGGSTPMQGAPNALGGTDTSSFAHGSQPQPLNGQNGAIGMHTGPLPFSATSILPPRPNLPDDPVIPHNGFATVEEGEKAFTHLLRKAGVDANWTWDQTMRAIITDPLYKALNTLAEKKATWQKYVDGLRAKEQEEREARLAKLRPSIRNMLKGNPNVFHYTTFATADKLFAQHPIWQQAKIEAERRLIFEEYVAELRQREVQETRAARARSISKIVALFKKMDVDVLTRWRQAHQMVLESEEWKEDEELQKLPTLDILLAFEDYSRLREREFEEQMRRRQVEKTRKERKAREAFRELLNGLVESGQIKARTKWKQVYPTFANDNRYLDMLGNPGSNPIELFWDIVDALDQKLDAKIEVAMGAVKRHNKALEEKAKEQQQEKEKQGESMEGTEASEDGAKAEDSSAAAAAAPGAESQPKPFVVGPETTEEEFMNVVKADADESVKALTDEDLKEIYQSLHDAALKKQAEEKRRAERKQRHLQDDLRYALKKVPELHDANLSYEEALPYMQELPEYKAIEDDESRRTAFAKFVKRQKERLREREREASEDGASTTSRRRKEPVKEREPERERERERDREHRDRDRDVERDRHHERDTKSDRRPHDHDSHGRHASRDHGRERERERDYVKDKAYYKDRERERDRDRDRDRDYYRSSRHRDYDRDDRRHDRRGSRSEWDDGYSAHESVPPFRERARSTSIYREPDPREKRDRGAFEERPFDERAEKRPRYSIPPEAPPVEKAAPVEPPPRAETPEEGEI
ncbi:hypothetical protein BV20DRAFT_1123833 [Pilatotrama ljubarskyi]|nr:hypothetical protein BV20DRAFT_1123833 [Pilatotrama ljubarskyi]